MQDRNYQDLTESIVVTAVDDYAYCMYKLSQGKEEGTLRYTGGITVNYITEMEDIEAFFKDSWFTDLVDIDSDVFIKACRLRGAAFIEERKNGKKHRRKGLKQVF